MAAIKYLVFDIETVADGELVSKLRYPLDKLSAADAIVRYRAELMAKYESDFIPYTFQIPTAVVIAKVDAEFRLVDLVSLDAPQFRPWVLTEHFWRGWEAYGRPTWVSFNGRTFDLPVLELAAFRYGLAVPGWFNIDARSFEQSRNRYNLAAHLDLQDVLTNYGATRMTGGLNLAANLLGKPGKMEVMGYMVQDLFNEGKTQEISDYCRGDVLDTYFVFLRTQLLLGHLTLAEEQERVAETKQWLEERAPTDPPLAAYLAQWGDWKSPWSTER